jgi:hypothetical protein
MNMLSAATKTMSSRELLDLINDARVQNGEPEIRLNKFNEKIEDELEGDYYTKSVVQNSNNTESVIYQLSNDQCMLISMRESKTVRRTVLEKLKTPALDLTDPVILHGLLLQSTAQIQIIKAERDHAIATKAQISDKKTAQAMNTASQAVKRANKLEAELGRCVQNATIIAVKNLTGTEYAWQPLRKWCKAQGVKAIEVVDARYGLVKSWPSAAWVAVHGVDLATIF